MTPASSRPSSRARDHRIEGVRVAQVVAERDGRAGPRRGHEPFGRLALAAGVARPHVDDAAAAIRLQAVVAEAVAGLDGLDRGEHRRARRGDVVGLADVERDGRPLALHEQPRRRAELDHDPGGQRLGVRRVALEPRLRRDRDRAAAAAREPPVLEAVVAEVVDAADARPRGDVSDGPPGQDRDRSRSGRAAAIAASRRSARRAPGSIRAAPGSRVPWDSVPSKSAMTRSGGRAATSRSRAAETAAGDEAASAGVA